MGTTEHQEAKWWSWVMGFTLTVPTSGSQCSYQCGAEGWVPGDFKRAMKCLSKRVGSYHPRIPGPVLRLYH